MSVKDNFYQAVKELFNKDEETQSPLAKSLQNNADDSSDVDSNSDTKETKGLSMASDNDTTNVASTPLKKAESSDEPTKPVLAGAGAAVAGYSSVQNSTKPESASATTSEPAKPVVSTPSSSLFGSKPATTTTTVPVTSGFGAKPITPATPSVASTPAPAITTPATTSSFGAKPMTPVTPPTPATSTPVSSLFAAKAPATPAVKEEKPFDKAFETSPPPIFSSAALSNAAMDIPKPKISTDELSASLNAIINDEYRPLSGSLESTIIAHGTVIKGDIQTTSDIEINGAIIGSIESQRSVSINGQVEGNVTAESIRLSQTSITGNLIATGLVILDKESTLIGDIRGENIIIGGKVKGNIDGKGKVTLKGDSIVAGNITIAEITIEDGAKLQGFIQTTN